MVKIPYNVEAAGLNAPKIFPAPPRPEGAPEPLKLDKLGIVGETVKQMEPYTEADSGALVLDMLASAGSCIGPGPHGFAGNRRHRLRLNVVLVGDTSVGGKGSSRGASERIWEEVDPDWASEHVGTGLSSGEGLVQALHDLPAGAKRFMVVEEEFGRILTIAMRKGETISEVIRQLWDKDDAVTLNRKKTIVQGAHFNFIGHITQDELMEKVRDVDIRNGFVNRNLWAYSHVARLIPDARMPEEVITRLALSLRTRIEAARQLGLIERDGDAQERWEEWYVRSRTQRVNGTLGYVLGRREAQAFRLQMLLAALDGSKLILPEHVERAATIWSYCQQSAAYIYGDKTGNPQADRILMALGEAPARQLARTAISNEVLGKNVGTEAMDKLRDLLKKQKRIETSRLVKRGRGRPVEVWRLK